MCRRLLPVVLVLLLGVVAILRGQAATSTDNPRLQRLLSRTPEADLNGDGVLTDAEIRQFRRLELVQLRDRPLRPRMTHADVAYGPAERNVLDLYLADSREPTPLVIYFHGGGFTGGDKMLVSPRIVAACHAAGISVASANYRFVTEAPFPAPQQDAARVVQFLRANAGRWNLDPDRFAAYGTSAGAGLALWVGFHDDLADPDSPDPIVRQSTRLRAVGSRGGQTTYDPNVIREWIGGRAHEHSSMLKCFGLKSFDEINDPRLQPLYDAVSPIKLLTVDDPPVYMVYHEADEPLPPRARPGQGIHHPIFGHKLKTEMDRLGIESVYRHTSTFDGNPDIEMVDYLHQWLTPANAASAASEP